MGTNYEVCETRRPDATLACSAIFLSHCFRVPHGIDKKLLHRFCAACFSPCAPSGGATDHRSFNVKFGSRMWDWYILIKHASEWLILFLMLWILHSSDEPGAEGDGEADDPEGAEEYWDGSFVEDPRQSLGDDPTAQLTGNGTRQGEYGTL